jgi:hypothetical protein
MAKLACALSFLVLCGLSCFEKSPDMSSATLRLALTVVFASALVIVARNELDQFIG